MSRASILLAVVLFTGCASTHQSRQPSNEYKEWQKALADAISAGRSAFDYSFDAPPDDEFAIPVEVLSGARYWATNTTYNGRELVLLPANAPEAKSLAEYSETPKLVVVCGHGTVSSFLRYYNYVKKPVSADVLLYNGQVQKLSEKSAAVQVWYRINGETKLLNPPILGAIGPGMSIDRSTGRLKNDPTTSYERFHDLLLRGANGLVFVDPMAKANGHWWGHLSFYAADFRKKFDENCY